MAKTKDGFYKAIDSKIGSDDYLLKAGGGYVGVGHSSGQVPLSDGTLNTSLNAEKINGYTFQNLEDRYVNVSGDKMTGTLKFKENIIQLDFRPDVENTYGSKIQYMTSNDEALVFSNRYSGTSFIFKCGYDLSDGSNWLNVGTPSVQIKGQALYVNTSLGAWVGPAYNFYVTGTGYFSGQVTSAVATGTAPFIISSTTAVSNLNADMVDGKHASDFATSGHTHDDRYVFQTQVSEEQNNDTITWPRSNASTNKRSLVYNTSGAEWSYLSSMRSDDSYGAILKFGYTGPSMYIMGKAGGTWTNWYKFLTSGNYTDYVYSKTESDDRYVNVSGDRMNAGAKLYISTAQADDIYGGGLEINNLNGTNYPNHNWDNNKFNAPRITFHWGGTTVGSFGFCGNFYRITAKDTAYTIWDSGNDGSGSGLDADLLDGHHASYFSIDGHTHSFILGSTTITTGNTYNTISGPLAIWTSASANNAFAIGRTSYGEAVKHWVDDATYHIEYTNDETSSNIAIRFINTDSESPHSPSQASDNIFWLTYYGQFYPDVNNSGSIGVSSKYWKDAYISTVHGSLDGNASSSSSTPWSGITGKPTSKTVWGQTYINSSGEPQNVSGTIYLNENVPHYFRDPNASGWRGGMIWGSAGSESLSFVVVNGGTRFQFVGGSDIASWNSETWRSSTIVPYTVINATGLGINIATPSYKLDVNGGLMRITNNSRYILIGPQNSSYCHYETNADSSHWFNKRVDVNGAIWRYGTEYGISSDGYFYSKGIYANRDAANNYGGISLYSTSDPLTEYGITFRSTGTESGQGGKFMGVTGDWATYFTMNNSVDRGWIFRRGGINVLAIDGYGRLNGLCTYRLHLPSQYQMPTGWYRLAKINANEGYFNFNLYLYGSWYSGAPSSCLINVCSYNTTPILTQIAGVKNNVITKIRVVNISGGQYYLDVYNNYTPTESTVADQYFLLNGNFKIEESYEPSTITNTDEGTVLNLRNIGTLLDTNNYTDYLYNKTTSDNRYVYKSGDTMTGQLYINYDQDVGLNQNGSLVIGNKGGENIAIDGNEIMARNNSSASTLYLQAEGGNLYSSAGTNYFSGNVGIGTASPSYKLHTVGKIVATSGNNTARLIPDSDCGLYMTTSAQWIHIAGSGGTMYMYNGSWDAAGTGNYNKGIQINSSNNIGINGINTDYKFYVNGTSNLAGDTVIGTKSYYYQRGGRGAVHHEFIGYDDDYGVMKIRHIHSDGSGGPGGYTATLAVIDERINNISGAYEPTFYINRSGATRVPDLMGVNVGGTRVFTITSGGTTLVNTSTNSTPFTIARGTSNTEALMIGVDDSTVTFLHQQDETISNFLFRGKYTDTESGGGANAGQKDITFALSSGDHNIYVGSYKVLHTGNTYVSNNKGYINGTEITQVNNSDKLDNIDSTGFLRWKCMENIGSSSPFQNAVDYFNNLNNLNNGGTLVYNHAGGEYTELFTRRNDSTAHGSILKWGYPDKYIRIIRMVSGSAQSTDWEKISAGYADSAGYATSAGNADTVDNYHLSDLDGRYVNVTGDSMSGRLSIQTQDLTKSSPVSQQLVINGPSYDENATLTNQSYPGIGFHMPGRTWANLIWNGYFSAMSADFSNYVSFYGAGFIKSGSDSSYVLLGDGGHKKESSLSVSYANSAGSATNADNATIATTLLTNNTSQAADACYNGAPGLHFYRYNGTSSTTGQSGGDGWILQWSWNKSSVGQQLYMDDNPSGIMCIRGCNGSDSNGNPSADPKFTSWWRIYTDAYRPYADTAGSVAWGNITGKPFNWSGQSGQPTWLWGSNDGTNYYVWNPSNFRVDYANSAGDSSKLEGLPLNRFVYSVGSGDYGTSERTGNSEDFERTMFWRDNSKGAIGVFVAHSSATSYGWEIHAGYDKNSDFVGRVKENGTWGNERTFITSANISSQSVNYATSAGSATNAAHLLPCNSPHMVRDASGWISGIYYGSAGNESFSFAILNSNTRFQFVTESNISEWTSSTWQSVTPKLQIHKSGVGINYSGTSTFSYPLQVNGYIYSASGFIKNISNGDDYVLLAGGGHKAISDFATGGGGDDTIWESTQGTRYKLSVSSSAGSSSDTIYIVI